MEESIELDPRNSVIFCGVPFLPIQDLQIEDLFFFQQSISPGRSTTVDVKGAGGVTLRLKQTDASVEIGQGNPPERNKLCALK